MVTRKDAHLRAQHIARQAIAARQTGDAAAAAHLKQFPHLQQDLLRIREATAAAVREQVALGDAPVSEFVRDNVRPRASRVSPSAARNAYLAARATILPHLPPDSLADWLTDAAERTQADPSQADELELYVEYARGIGYRKVFGNHGPLAMALVDGKQALEGTPDALARAEAAQFADEVRGELSTLEKILNGRDPLESLQVHQQLGALRLLLPAA